MDEQPQCNVTESVKETTKFENLSNEIDKTPSLITQIFQIVSNIENKLGESMDIDKSDCEKRPEPSSIIEKNTMKVRDVNDDLISIGKRLANMQKLF